MARLRRSVVTAPTQGGSKNAVNRRANKQINKAQAKILPYDAGEVLIPSLMKPSKQKYRHGKYVHVSDLVSKCLRKVAVSDKYHIPIPDSDLWPSLRLTFAQGTAIADVMVNDAIQQSTDLVYARWSCACGVVEETGVHSYVCGKKICNKCGGINNKYNELTFTDEEYAIVGNCDLALLINDALYLTEIKSIAGEAWKTLEAPKPDHTLQALFYWLLARRNGHSLHDKISIIYASKGYVFGNPYKEFTVQPSKSLHRLDEYLEDAKALKEYKDGGKLPMKVECPTIDCTMAKNCHISGPCFDEYDVGN